MMRFTIESISIQAKSATASIDSELHPRIASLCGVPAHAIASYRILRRSIDARKKPDIKILYKLEAEIKEGFTPSYPMPQANSETASWRPPENSSSPLENPLVVGAGPAGLFAALAFAIAGCKPVVVERGFDVDRRKADIDRFFKTRSLNPDSNMLFGEGGAGTWSDGKLYTRVRDERMRFILETLVKAGAPQEILYFSHPHIGSDKLPSIVTNIRRMVESLGGRFIWGSKVSAISSASGRFKSLKLSGGESIEAPLAVVASGHSARDLTLSIASAGVRHCLKGFQLGLRIEHPQAFINFMQYGLEAPPPALGAADYNLSSRPSQDQRIHGATSFCMCPGGEIIPACSDKGFLSTNGMSKSSRSGCFGNSAIVVNQSPDSFKDAADAFAFLASLESAAFKAGGSGYSAPAQTSLSFVKESRPELPRDSSYALGLKPSSLSRILPQTTGDAIKRALLHFDKLSYGFIRHGVLIGVESRVSSPVRFERNPETLESSMPGLYVAGEGAGMAGGIVSAALDGLRIAEAAILSKRP